MIKSIAEFIDDDNAVCDVVTNTGREYRGCNIVSGNEDRVMIFEWAGKARIIPMENIDHIDYYPADHEEVEDE